MSHFLPKKLLAFASSFSAVLILAACVKNPVTGRNDILLVSEDWELQVGKQQYLPLRQQQGGDYVADPNVENYVRAVGNKLAAQSDRKLPYEFNVINDSTPNAWALPGGKISINRGLLVQLKTEAELAAVLGHEIVHSAAKHGAKGQTRNLGLQLGVMTASVIGERNGYGQEVQMLSSVGAQIINSRYGQGAELESDKFGMEYMAKAGYDPRGAVGLQQTFVRLSKGRANNPLTRLFASHPPSEKRVAENIKTAATLKRGGVVGADTYKGAMSRLFKTQGAYNSFDKAVAAFKNGNARQASTLVRSAIKVEPREARFHSLVGEIAIAQKNLGAAKNALDRAISLDPDYYYAYLKRGQVHEAQRNIKAAQADYGRSIKLLPTTSAQLSLGQFAQRAGKQQVAKRYYAMAAQATGADAETAKRALQKLQPSNNNDTRLLVRQGLTRQGTFAIELINQTPQSLRNIQLGIRGSANAPQRIQVVRQVLRSGQKQVIDTGRRITQEQANRIKVVIVGADVVR